MPTRVFFGLRRSGSVIVGPAVVAGAALAVLGACRTGGESSTMSDPSGSTPSVSAAATPGYEASVNGWHRSRLERLVAEDGWLTLVGLDWLEPGPNPVGRGEDATVRAEGFAADRVGTIVLEADGTLRFEPAGPGLVTGLPADGVLVHDGAGEATVLVSGRVRLHVIERDGRLGVRLRDPEAPTRTGFRGIERFPVDPSWRIVADFEPAAGDEPPLAVEMVTGGFTRETVAGRARFVREGHEVVLVLLEGGGDGYFVVFGDETNGRETYGAGRFLVAEPAATRDTVVLDFNRAYDPPCSFTPFATCPLPPATNRLPFAVTAGERRP